MTPDRTRILVPIVLREANGIPVELHTHCNTGLGPLCALEAIKLGIDIINAAPPPLANGGGTKGEDERIVLHLSPVLAPIKIAVFPLLKNKPELVAKAQEIYQELRKTWRVEFDDNGNVGKRYRRQDEIGTPFCVTVDFDTIEKDNTVTVRERDSMEQKRIKVEDLVSYFSTQIK